MREQRPSSLHTLASVPSFLCITWGDFQSRIISSCESKTREGRRDESCFMLSKPNEGIWSYVTWMRRWNDLMFMTSLCHLTALKPAVLLFGMESYFRRFGSSRQDNLTHVSWVWKVLLCLVWSPSWGASADTQRGHLTWQHPAFNLTQRTPVLHYWAELQQLVQCASEIPRCNGAGTAFF